MLVRGLERQRERRSQRVREVGRGEREEGIRDERGRTVLRF